MSTYKTLAHTSESLYKEKGSKFYGFAYPIHNVDEYKILMRGLAEEHPKARHICSALLLGSGDEEYYLMNDDGEPNNSAGAPILGQIRSHDITNASIAVVRYFGGTKLGLSGLISAYKIAADEAIKGNKIIKVEPTSTLIFEVSYALLGDILSVIDRNNLEVSQEHHTLGAKISISCKTAELNAIKQLFAPFDITIT